MSDEIVLPEYEDELEPEEDDAPSPFTYSLTSYGIDFDVAGVVRRLDAGTIFVPDFQRRYVWPLKKASKFVESLLLGLPVPGIFLYRVDATQKLMIIDGQQRLQTLRAFHTNNFRNNPFRLKDVVPRPAEFPLTRQTCRY